MRMKIIDKLLLPVALAFAVAAGGVAAHLARSIPTNAAAPDGIELPIVMYHHVLKEAGRLNQFTVSPDEFRMDMQYLKDCGYSPIVIQDLINYVREGAPLPEKPVMITFDDGYESFHEYVYPILQEYQYKAVYSVVGTYADQYSQIDDHHIRYSHSTWNELKAMHDSGLVEIQNHSYDLHHNDGARHGAKRKPGENLALYRDLIIEDLGKLQQECKENLGWAPTCFTYPFGQISSDTLPILKDMGFQAALTCEEKLNYITGDPEQLYHLRRFNRPHGKSLQAILEAQKQK
ncbi:polysaccharide deacetylase [Anaerotruncus colihominis]|uniref:Polysaccharide deacetylase n=2 Tax=Oscillospiraceae TaxID=216572 RepID=A0A845SS54_9FIRM|nr:polysaccharide deacetylase family protein [Anaerotruncus sp.]NBI80373.1 polysaccharide deacetylase [Anaerotruncus colihominis]NDO39879.1 polysaccharide deacetylase family protein [Anaerotruncus colihominis]